MPLVWNGTQFDQEDASDTDESDSEPPLTDAQQVDAIQKSKSHDLPPLPANSEYAMATAQAVQQGLLAIPTDKRTIAHALALSIPCDARTVEQWACQQLRRGRKTQTLKSAFCWALNPHRTNSWVCLKSHGHVSGGTAVAKGLALHLRMHPFTWRDVHVMDIQIMRFVRRRQTELMSAIKVTELAFKRDPRTLEAAHMMVALQRSPRGAVY
jgi:hypothetical protein